MAANLPTVERAERELMDLLASGRIRPGDRLVESRLADEMGLNRGAVREALNRLVAGDVVEYVPYSGYRLKAFGPRDLLEMVELREAIEPVAACIAAERAQADVVSTIEEALCAQEDAIKRGDRLASWRHDRDFHHAIVRASGNTRFVRIYNQMRVDPAMMSLLFNSEIQPQIQSLHGDPYSGDQATVDSHYAIFKAIKDRRPFDARDAAAEHVFWAKDTLIRFTFPRLLQSSPTDIAKET